MKNKTKASKCKSLLFSFPAGAEKKISEEFETTEYMAGVAKKLSEKEILSCLNPKPGKTLKASAVNVVTKFYKSDDISREMPGMKDKVW